jgi:hypothetical protein
MSATTVFQSFENEWLGKWVDYDKEYGYQCVDLIKQYMHECYGLTPGTWGDAIKYWTNTAPAILTKFAKEATSVAQAGDVVVFWGLPGNSAGHIGIATGNENGLQVEVLEQDGHTGTGAQVPGNQIRTRYIDRSRVAGILRPVASTHNETVKPVTWNVRSAPSTAGAILGIVRGGQVFNTTVVAGNWRQINYGGHVGYVGPAAWS